MSINAKIVTYKNVTQNTLMKAVIHVY